MNGYNKHAAVQPRPLLYRVFPTRDLPPSDSWEHPEPGFAPGEFGTSVVVYLDWRDRLRMLVSGLLRVEVRTATDCVVERAKSRSVVYVLPPGSMKPSQGRLP